MTVKNRNNVMIDWGICVALMDDAIREELNNTLTPCSEQEFMESYEAAHEEKFGSVWELSKANPVY